MGYSIIGSGFTVNLGLAKWIRLRPLI